MYSLQKISSSTIKPPSQHINYKYSTKLSDFERSHLFYLLFSHLESKLSKTELKSKIRRLEATTTIAADILREAWLPHPHESLENEIRKQIGGSVSDSMKKVTHRTPWTKKGVMYEEEYFNLFLRSKEGYMSHDQSARRGLIQREYQCFTTGRTVCDLIKKDQTLASDAIHSFFEGPISADCGSTIEAVFLKAILDLLGDEKFNKLFDKKMEIHRQACCYENHSGISPFLEYANRNTEKETYEKDLLIGDHLMVTGTPWYPLKHPTGNMSNAHGVIVGFNEQKEALFQGLGMYYGQSITLAEANKMLIDYSNNLQDNTNLEYIRKYHGCNYPSDKFLKVYFKERPHFKPFDKTLIFNESTVDQAKAFGGCQVRNDSVTRISSYVVAVLQEASLNDDLEMVLYHAKARVIMRQLFNNRNEYLNFLKDRE